jgi:subtilisin family serine protease
VSLDDARHLAHLNNMQRIGLNQWTKVIEAARLGAVAPLLFGTMVLGMGCDDGEERHDIDHDALRDRDILALPPGPESEGDLDAQNQDINFGPSDIEGHYIVQLKDGSNPATIAAAVKVNPKYSYTHVFPGFAGSLNATQLSALQKHPHVVSIEADQIVTAVETVQHSPPWGLDRIDQCGPVSSNGTVSLTGTYTYTATGKGVKVYIFDTGIDFKHKEFGGRAIKGYDAWFKSLNSPKHGDDCNGHGTHVAGTVGSTTFGVAKEVTLVAVRVLGCNGSGSVSGIIDGIEWAIHDHQNNLNPATDKPFRAVANFSLGGGKSQSLDNAVKKLALEDVSPIIAAGNSNANACNYSPAGLGGTTTNYVYTVGATNSADTRANFSNHGSCVDIFAPGVDILSTLPGDGTGSYNGTSMATPHVAGVAALYKQDGVVSSENLKSRLTSCATHDKLMLGDVLPNTPNAIVHSLCPPTCEGEDI